MGVNETVINYVKITTHNFSSQILSKDELTALSYGLDDHILRRINPIKIHTKLKQFYGNLLRKISNMPEGQLSHLANIRKLLINSVEITLCR